MDSDHLGPLNRSFELCKIIEGPALKGSNPLSHVFLELSPSLIDFVDDWIGL